MTKRLTVLSGDRDGAEDTRCRYGSRVLSEISDDMHVEISAKNVSLLLQAPNDLHSSETRSQNGDEALDNTFGHLDRIAGTDRVY